MNAFLPLLLPILCLYCAGALAATAAAPTPATAPTVAVAPAVPASPNASASTVNPLTGQPLAFEATQRRLEQMRLETQLLEEEARQAAIRSNMSLVPARRSNEERRLQTDMFGPAAAGGPLPAVRGVAPPAAAGRAVAAAPTRGRTPVAQPTAAAPAMPAGASTLPPPQGPQVLAILRNGERRRAILQAGGTTATVSEGEDWIGRRIGPITDGSVTVDGVVIDLPRNPAVIAAVDRRPPPGQPQAVQANAPAAVPRGPAGAGPAQAFPSLPPLPPLPVIGPLDPRNPLSAIGPQPTLAMPVTAMPPRPLGPGVPAAMPGAPVSDLLP
jgi:hypothetical protein